MTKCRHGKDDAFACSACIEEERTWGVVPIPVEQFTDMIDVLVDPMAYAMRAGARIGKLAATHDPCENEGCGHGRLLHKRAKFPNARDAVLSETHCRREGCSCEAWVGTETPFPKGPY